MTLVGGWVVVGRGLVTVWGTEDLRVQWMEVKKSRETAQKDTVQGGLSLMEVKLLFTIVRSQWALKLLGPEQQQMDLVFRWTTPYSNINLK